MAAPVFGFSVGDFITGIQLTRDLIKALNESAGAKATYRRLITELLNLDDALNRVRHLKVDGTHNTQRIALEQVAVQCQSSITEFLRKSEKFKTTLGTGPGASSGTLDTASQPPSTSSPSKWRSTMHKIQWALLKDGEIQVLRTQILAHTTTINLILNTIQL